MACAAEATSGTVTANVGTLVLGYMLVGSILRLQLTPAHIFVGSGGNAAY